MPPLHALFGRVRIKLEINKGSALYSLKAGITPGKDENVFSPHPGLIPARLGYIQLYTIAF
jgi:hypothetical protein